MTSMNCLLMSLAVTWPHKTHQSIIRLWQHPVDHLSSQGPLECKVWQANNLCFMPYFCRASHLLYSRKRAQISPTKSMLIIACNQRILTSLLKALTYLTGEKPSPADIDGLYTGLPRPSQKSGYCQIKVQS